MDPEQNRTAEVIAFLLEGARDNLEGLCQAARLARNPELRSLFFKQADAGQALVDRIEGEAGSFERPVPGDGTMIGDIHKAFTWARNSLARGSDKALVEEAVCGSSMIAKRFETIAADERIPAKARDAAAEGLASLRRQQGEIGKMASHYG